MNRTALLLLALGLVVACDCGNDNGDPDAAGVDAPGSDSPGADVQGVDVVVPPDACLARDQACASPDQCCSGVCEGGTCGEAAGCEPLGDPCTAAGDCCSGNCVDDGGEACTGAGCVCGPSPACVPQAGACTSDAQCCNRLCDRPDGADEGTCASFGACLSAGEPCESEGQSGACCSTLCLNTDGTGPRCQFLGGCRVQDELCGADGECCSGVCEETDMTLDGRSIMRCANADSCLPAGEVCGDGGASSNCCPNGGGDTGCEPTGTGFRRCFGGDGSCTLPGAMCETTEECCTDAFPEITCAEGVTGEMLCCLPDGEECAFADVCCGGVCVPDSEGVLRCGAECVPDDGLCTTAADCCGCACVADDTGTPRCSSDPADCMACEGPQLGEFCERGGTPCCNGPTVICGGGEEFPTCVLNPDA